MWHSTDLPLLVRINFLLVFVKLSVLTPIVSEEFHPIIGWNGHGILPSLPVYFQIICGSDIIGVSIPPHPEIDVELVNDMSIPVVV